MKKQAGFLHFGVTFRRLKRVTDKERREEGSMEPEEKWKGIPDHELMRLAAAGEKTAFEVIVLRYRQEAWRYCVKLIKDTEQAEDIVQDSFVDIYVKRASYKPSFSFRTYLYTILRNKAYSHLRKNGRMLPDGDVSKEEAGKASASPEETLLKREAEEMLGQWLLTLPGHQRTALYLFCVEGMSYEEIALRMKKTKAQVKIWIYRARKAVQNKRREWEDA